MQWAPWRYIEKDNLYHYSSGILPIYACFLGAAVSNHMYRYSYLYYNRNGKWIYKYKELHSLYQDGILRVVSTYLHPICTTHAGIHSASHLHVTTFDHMSVSWRWGCSKTIQHGIKYQTTHYHISKHPKTSANVLAIAILYALTFLKLPKKPLGITKTPSPMYGPSPETVDTCSWRLPLSGEFWSNLVGISCIFMWNPPPASYLHRILLLVWRIVKVELKNGWKGPTLALSRGCTWNSIPHEAADFTVTIIFYHNINICVYYIHVCIYIYACMYVYIYIYACMYVYIYMRTYYAHYHNKYVSLYIYISI